ncbi:MAG: 1-acyl-sn-glycerol-3-phosphate acyltransferase [Anaerolineales bacterium]|nr:1-acyl-sn-glycerol-3-phosphate acyltransferase [Anaerolineales bacterium]
MRRLLRNVLSFLFHSLTRLKVSGVARIPLEGSCLLTSNHLGIVDGPLIFCLLRREDATGLVALKHKKNPAIRFIVETARGIWIDRTRTDFQALKDARAYLKNGGLLGVTPEGTRSHTHALIEAKPGVAFLVDKSNAAVVPMAVRGSENALRKMFTLQRPKIEVRIGEPFRLPPLDRKDRDGSLQRNTDEIMCRIAALLPENYRGFYAGHPRLKALLKEQAVFEK